MGRNYYIFSSGKVKRKDNTIFFEYEKDGDRLKRPIPVENVDQIFFMGEVDLNSKFLSFASQNNVVLHFFNYYGYYSGSFYPRERHESGKVVVKQVEHYLDENKRLNLAKKFVEGAVHNLKRNLEKRNHKDLLSKVNSYQRMIDNASSIVELMSYEAHVRKLYYSQWESITGWPFGERSIRPPSNELNALISFGNSLVYSLVLKELYHTPLNPTISYLHEPAERRFSLALDISEIFKPVLVDRLIFRLINRNQLNREKHFVKELKGILLNEEGRKIFVEAFDNFLQTTVVHRKLKRKVRYQSFVRLEAYKILKHILGDEEYKPLKVWW